MGNEDNRFDRFEELFWEVTRGMGKVWARIFDAQLPGSQAYLIHQLEQEGRVRMSRLAESLRLTGGAVTSASDKLIERGFVRRIRDEEDRRVVYLEITDEGRRVIGELRQQGRKEMKRVFGLLSEEELDTLIRVFEQAGCSLGELKEDTQQA
ncbi:MarR family winged helix-turn-helix transcriptional regulator [Bhargavaea ullalensis]|uniref:DNA-binding MarR family transcriptional regulator n=1 Tax=Bhargavaea ullalensis TaxID=1265685 RepID=A0ABV2GCQ1_9BACL